MKRKVVSMLLCAVMLTSMAGCQMTDSSAEGGDTTAKEESSSGDEAKDEEKTEAADGAVTLDLYLDHTWFPTDSWTGIIPETLTENGGVYFDVTRSADDSQLGLMIASGELPDVIFTDKEIDRLCDSNLCWSYDELIEKYNVDWEPTADRIGIAKSHNANKDDDHYYTIIQNYSTNEEWKEAEGVIPGISGLYYRKDIWEELGSPAMNTIEDIIKVCEMVKEKYPDMDVINAGNPSWRLAAFRDWCGASNEFLYTEDGSVAYRDTTEQFYNYLKLANELYRKGFYTEENLAITVEDDAKQQAISGKSFIYEWNARPTHLAQLNSAVAENVEGAEFAPLSIPDDAEEMPRSNTGWAAVFISKNRKDPEAAIKMIAYMNSEEGHHLALWGREGIEYELDDKGVPQFSDEWKEASKNEEAMVSKYNNYYYMCTTELDEAYTYYSGVDSEIVEAFTKNTDGLINYPELSLAVPTSTSDMGIVLAKIKEARDAEYVKIYTAGSEDEFEAAYEDYMGLLDKIGVQELNEYMTSQAKTYKEEFGF